MTATGGIALPLRYLGVGYQAPAILFRPLDRRDQFVADTQRHLGFLALGLILGAQSARHQCGVARDVVPLIEAPRIARQDARLFRAIMSSASCMSGSSSGQRGDSRKISLRPREIAALPMNEP